ncbi:DUF402 domain-containing protein [Krasilnikoviella flava]|uniref:DUF402 domain-containing protein n=1 Tax=Krasilnikoviella flava TaxID=526729 RepID=A0A1T5KWR6_9MICO|nr:DUF402 domain-containing protein [Krasilnikoviella flava]SKC67829.1 hypothetical protein SAMN04324258_2502 [Krasilnikoviella flava]
MADDDVRIVWRKFDGSLHWHHPMTRLGQDEFGVWLGAPAGTVYTRGERDLVVTVEDDRVVLFPRDGWWTAEFQAAPARLDAYCDVATPAVWSAGEVTMVDLDLDVCRVREDMSVYVDDEDEFAVHQVRYGYPADVVEKAEAAAVWLTAALRDGVEPFGSHYRSWLDRLSVVAGAANLRPA